MNTSFINPISTGGFLGKGNSAPPTPDFVGAANAQGAANVDTARLQGKMGNPNIFTPQGSQTVSWNGDQPTINRTLSPEQQALFTQQNRISAGVGDVAEQGVKRIGASMGQDFNMSGVPGRVNSVPTPDYQRHLDLNTNFAGGVDTSGVQRNLNTAGIPAPNFDFHRGQVPQNVDLNTGGQYSFNHGPVQGSVNGAGEGARNAVEQAMYSRATARLDPRFQQSDDNLRSNLVAQGLHEGTTAWDRAWQNQNMAKNDAYSSAQNDAITAGGAEQSRQFNMNVGAGQFANSAQAQEANQNLQGANLYNTQAQTEATRRLEAGKFAQAGQGQDAGQNLQAATLGNAAGAQQFGQVQAGGQFANSAQAQDVSQRAQNVGLVNQALLARNQATLQGGNFRNAATEAGFNAGVTGGNFTNAQRQQAIQEQAYMRQLPLSEVNSLRTGAQPTMPTFQNFQGPQVAAPPIFGAATAQAQNANDIYNAQVGSQNAQMSSLGQLGMAGAMYFSDRRLKRNVKLVGALPSGLPLYEYEYLWGGGKQIGVMAHEASILFPDAVRMVAGFLAVDYGRIY